MRKGAHPALGIGDADGGEQAERLVVASRGLGDLLPIRMVGFSEVIGSWKTAPRSSRRTLRNAFGSPVTMSAPVTRTVPSILRVLGQQSEHGEPEHALAGTGFAHQAEDLAGHDVEGYPAQRGTSEPFLRNVT